MDRTLVSGLRLREATPTDAGGIRDFVCRLSPLTQHLRFFGAVAPPSSGLVRALCGTGGDSDILLVTDGAGDVVAHAMAVDDQGSHCSEIAVVVADNWQDKGIGTTLLSTLADRMAGRGVPIMTMEVLPENRRMLGIIARRWPEAERERTSDSIIIRAAISKRTGYAAGRQAA